MIDRFVITGFPRSRTSWCANLFTYGPCFCLHDALASGGLSIATRISEAAFADPRLTHFGISDSGYLLLNGDDWTCGTKVILIRRGLNDAARSFAKFFETPYPGMRPPDLLSTLGVFMAMEKRFEQIAAMVPSDFLRIVPYNDLDNAEKCRELWSFICPEEPFSIARWRTLDTLRVNPATEKVDSAVCTFALRFADVRRKAVA